MGIFTNDGNNITEYKKINNLKEKDIEKFLYKHPTVLDPDISIIGRQVPTNDKKKIDLMGMDNDGNVIIIETKLGKTPRETLAQILDYEAWAKKIEYNDLNEILSRYSGGKNNLSKKFSHGMPKKVNDKRRLYIVATQIDEKLIDRIMVIKNEVKCIEINFYKNNDQRLIDTKYVYGDRKKIRKNDKTSEKKNWHEIFVNTDPKVKNITHKFIQQVKKKYNCVGKPQGPYYYFKNAKNKKPFAAIRQNKKINARLYFKCDLNTFKINHHKVKQRNSPWFFYPHDKYVSLDPKDMNIIFKCLDHAYGITKNT